METLRGAPTMDGAGIKHSLRSLARLVLFIALALPAGALAFAPTDVTPTFGVLYAPEGTYQAQDFLGGEPPAALQPLDPPANIAALGREAWLYTTLEANGPGATPRILEIPGQIFNYIDVWFRLPDGTVTHQRAGDRYPYNERTVKHAGIAFEVPSPDTGPLEVLIRAKNDTSHAMNFAALVWSGQDWTEYLFAKRIWYGVFLGAIFALCVYNLFLAATLWESAYLFYVGYILCLTVSVVLLSGLAEEYLWPDGKPASFVLTLAATGAALAVGFVNRFLRIRDTLPRVYRFSSALALLAFVSGLLLQFGGRLPLIPEAYSARTIHCMVILAGLYFIGVSVSSYLAGIKQARFLALSMFCLLGSIFVYFSYTYAFVPYNLFIGHSLELGALAEGILLSLALADRINLLNQEKRAAQKQALDYHQSFSRRLIEAQEKERQLLAETLHDSIGHGILVLKNNLGRISRDANGGDALPVGESLRQEVKYCGDLVDELRRIAHDLHPHILQRLGLSAAVESTMQRALEPLGVEWTVEVDPLCETLDPNLQSTIYRAVQECLSNIMKYADATEVSCEIVCDTDVVKALICDNGKGFDTRDLSGNSLGLREMEGRLQVVGGRMHVESTAGAGTTLEFEIPRDTDSSRTVTNA